MNPFQTRYPLSPKKFWKKFIPSIIPSIIMGVIVGVLSGIAIAFMNVHATDYVGTAIVAAAAIGILAIIVILFLQAWYFKAFIRSYFYEGGENFVTIRKLVFTPREIHVQYQKIQDVYVDQDLLDRIMGLYDVHIASATAASGMEAHIDGVDAATAEGLKNFFLEKIQAGSSSTSSSIPGVDVSGPQNSAAPASTVQFSSEISSQTYPLRPVWMIKSIIGAILSSFFLSLFIAFYIFAKASDSTDGANWAIPAFFGVWAVVTVFHIIGLFLWKSNYRFAFLPEYIQFRTGILSQSERHLPYKSVQDVNVSQSLLDRLFGLANVMVENAAQVVVGSGSSARAVSAGVKIVGITLAQANAITEALKPVLLAKDSSHMGL